MAHFLHFLVSPPTLLRRDQGLVTRSIWSDNSQLY